MNKRFIFLIFLFVILLARFISAEDCISFTPSDFDEDVDDVQEINCAIQAELTITNEQYALASDKQTYVLSSRINLSDETQRADLQNWLLFYVNAKKIEGKEFNYALYFDWVFSNKTYNLTENELIVLEASMNLSKDLINQKTSYFVKNVSVNNDTTLFTYFADRVNNISFAFIDGTFSGSDYYYNGLGENIFYAEGEQASNFSFEDLEFLTKLGFSDYYISERGRLGALKYNSQELSSDTKIYRSSEGWVFEGKNIDLPNNVTLVNGAAILGNKKMTFVEGSSFEKNTLLFETEKRIVLSEVECTENELSCINFREEAGKNILNLQVKNNNLKIVETEDVSAYYVVDFINDESKLTVNQFILDSVNNSFVFTKDDVLVKGVPKNDIVFNKMYNEEPCSLYISKDVTMGCGASTENPDAFSKTLRNNIIHMIENHEERVTEDGVGSFYGSESGSACFNYKGVLNEQEMWVASALNNLRDKKICLGLNSCVNKVKALRTEGLTDAQKVYYYFAVKGGKIDSEARIFAINYDQNSRLLGDLDLRDYTLGMSYCSDFVHRTLKRTYEDVEETDRWKEVDTDAYMTLPTDKARVESIHYMLMHYVIYEGWDLILLDPHNSLGPSLASGKSNFNKKDGKVYMNTLIPATPKVEVKLVVGGYYKKENNVDLKNLAEKLGDKAGLVSIQYGYHAATLVAIDGELYIGEQHWSENEKENNVELSKLSKHWLGYAVVAVPPGVLN
ncbi:hypothetical protein COV13_03350 [Candidatus Woesearchaeota archaeon CG10_big_fil_rev_8_21_14_0_10_32_9]|nr:MAG: hypothetical protein COV13_03350 [Candidatus Woesearchaeota archaeon CG10_big_fil_rev_8_21_14_0_10_32_9]